MALVAFATCAVVLSARNKHFVIALGCDVAFHRLSKAGPPCAAFIFIGAVEQGQITCGANVSTGTVLAVERTAAGRFGLFLEQHLIGGGGNKRPPLLGWLIQRPNGSFRRNMFRCLVS